MAIKGKPKARTQATARKQETAPRPAAADGPRTVPPPIELPDGMWERIAQKAHALWEERGRPEGRDLENWLDAETAVMDEIHEARE